MTMYYRGIACNKSNNLSKEVTVDKKLIYRGIKHSK
jgi:hypothetical protein